MPSRRSVSPSSRASRVRAAPIGSEVDSQLRCAVFRSYCPIDAGYVKIQDSTSCNWAAKRRSSGSLT